MFIPLEQTVKVLVEESVDPNLLTPGDFILSTKDGLLHRLIAYGQRLRFPAEFSKYTHAALVIDKNGTMLEADSQGIAYTNIADYTPKEYLYVHINATPEDRAEVIAFAKASHNEPYGYVDLFSAGLSVLLNMRFSFGLGSTMICSGFVARALERTTFIPPADPAHLSPAALAYLFRQTPDPVTSTQG